MLKAKADEFGSDEQRWSELMISAQAGTEKDYHVLLTEISGVVEAYLRSRIGHHHFIEDCVQDTLVAIHNARHTYDARRPFRPWMFAIVRHKAIDCIRRQRSHQGAVERYRQELAVSGLPDSPTAEQARLPGQLIDALSPQHREAITLTKIDGLTTAEAAQQLSISEGALKVRVHRAIARLKRLVEADTK